MKRILIFAALMGMLTACASGPRDGADSTNPTQAGNGVQSDAPAVRGGNVHLGIGIGSWGRHGGGGAGIGLGW